MISDLNRLANKILAMLLALALVYRPRPHSSRRTTLFAFSPIWCW